MDHPFFFYIREKQHDIHRGAAELERKIPPVIGTAANQKCQAVLFPDLRQKHQKPADKKERAEPDGFIEIWGEDPAHKNRSFI